MKLNKFTVTALSVVTLQNIAHANTSVSGTKVKGDKSGKLTKEYNNHIVSPLAEMLYTALDKMIVVRPKNSPDNAVYLDDYCGEEYCNHTDVIADNMEHYVTCIMQFICDYEINPNELLRRALAANCISNEAVQASSEFATEYLESSREDVFSHFCALYPKTEGDFLSGIPINILQARTPNTINTMISYAVKENKIHTTIDHQVVAMTCRVLEEFIQTYRPFERNVNSRDTDGNTGITNHVGDLVKKGVQEFKKLNNARYLRVDFIRGDGGDKKSGSSTKLFGDMTLPNIMECDMPITELTKCLMTVDKAVCDERPDGVRSLLTTMVQKSIELVAPVTSDAYENKQTFLSVLTDNNDSKYMGIYNMFNETLKEYLEEDKDRLDLMDCYRHFYKTYTIIDNPEDTNKLGNIRLRNCKIYDESMILFFCSYFLAYTTLDELSSRLARHGYTLLHARLFPVSNIKGDTLLTHLTNIYKCELEFPLTDDELETVDIQQVASVRLAKTYFGNFHDVCVRPLAKVLTLNVSRILQETDDTYIHVDKEIGGDGSVIKQFEPDVERNSDVTGRGMQFKNAVILSDDLTKILSKIKATVILDIEEEQLSAESQAFYCCFEDRPVFLSEVLLICSKLNGTRIDSEDGPFGGLVEFGVDFMYKILVEIVLKNKIPPSQMDKWLNPEDIMFASEDYEYFKTSFNFQKFLQYIEKRITPLYNEVVAVTKLRIPKYAENVFGKLDYLASFYYLHASVGLVHIDESGGMLEKMIAYINYKLSGRSFSPRLIGNLSPEETEALVIAMLNISMDTIPEIKKIDEIERHVKAHLESLYVPPVEQCKNILLNLRDTAIKYYVDNIKEELMFELERVPDHSEVEEVLLRDEIVGDDLVMLHQTVYARVGHSISYGELGIAHLDDTPMFRIHRLAGSSTQMQVEFLSVKKGGILCKVDKEEERLITQVLGEYSY